MSLVTARAHSHLTLKVTDLDRSIAWWRELFDYDVFRDGPAPTPDRARAVMGLVGGVVLELITVADRPVAMTPNTLGLVGISLTVDDVDASLAAIIAAGHAPLTGAIQAENWRVAFLGDPDGNIVELIQQPHGARTLADLAERLRLSSPG